MCPCMNLPWIVYTNSHQNLLQVASTTKQTAFTYLIILKSSYCVATFNERVQYFIYDDN